jgi:serine/threonine protein phosphatase PrpC
MLDLDFAQLSDPGRLRGNNEDYLGSFQPATPDDGRSHGWFFALADGVGGHDKGEVASHAAVEHVLAGFRAAPPGEPLPAMLVRLIRSANQHVYEVARQASPGGSTMATTLVACALRYNRAVVAHAGDSRCYLVREGQATQLTRDHTVAQDRERLGLRSSGGTSAATRNQLVRSLGIDLFLNVETSEHQVLPGDVLLLCCDGLHHSVSETDIAAVAGHETDLNSAARQLVALANQRDGSDNISVQLVRVRSVERVGIYRGRPYKLR